VANRVEEAALSLPVLPSRRRILIAGTFDRDHPRNALALEALVAGGVEAAIDAQDADAVWVGHPPLRSVPGARRAARGRPVIVNALDELTGELGPLRRQVLRLADLVVTETAASAASMAARTGFPPGKFAACPTGAPRGFAPPWSAAVPFTCLVFGSWYDAAGLAVALPEILFRVVGEAARGGPENLTAIAQLDPGPLAHEVRRAGCVVAAAPEAPRTVPAAAFLALACGAPLITTDAPAARELVSDGVSALLVPPGAAAALAQAVAILNADFDMARRLSAGGLGVSRERAGEDARGRRWRALLEAQIGTASRSR
jgi:hypothetical protein